MTNQLVLIQGDIRNLPSCRQLPDGSFELEVNANMFRRDTLIFEVIAEDVDSPTKHELEPQGKNNNPELIYGYSKLKKEIAHSF